jgi:5-methylcytosine-specific restriction endonuclease McrBC regulatory subunit McrC
MFPDLVLKHKETGQIIVFDAKFKTMRFVKQDLDRADFYQIHSYIQYYLPKAVLGGLLYPLSKNNNGDANYASSLFESEDNNTGFIIDGVFVNEEMTEQQINISEQEFLLRLKDVINRKLVS